MSMTDTSRRPLALYRLLPALIDEMQTLRFDESLVELKRWQINGSPGEFSNPLRATWLGDEEYKSEFPSGYSGAPVLSRRIADLLRADLMAAGSLLPLVIDGSDAEGYVLFVVESVVDCVDAERSSKPKEPTGEIQQAVFRADAVPVDLPAFRLPQFPTAVYWNGWAVERLTELVGKDLEARLAWSEDPDLTPHPNPWGF
jgi:hypothetical protein